MYYRVRKMNDNVLMWLLGGLFAGLLACFGFTNRKLDKKEFEDHCHKSEKLDNDITEMKLDIREIKTILKDLK
jgi:hypothetical protein